MIFLIFKAGRTALHYAAADPNGEHMIKVLQKSGGDAFIEDNVDFKKTILFSYLNYSLDILLFSTEHMVNE